MLGLSGSARMIVVHDNCHSCLYYIWLLFLCVFYIHSVIFHVSCLSCSYTAHWRSRCPAPQPSFLEMQYKILIRPTITHLSSSRKMHHLLGLYSLSGKWSYRQILWNLKAMRFNVIMIVSLWNLTGILATLLSWCLSNFRVIGKV